MSRCESLQEIDLTQVLRVNLRQLFHALQSMPNLEVLNFANDSTHGDGVDWGTSYEWPPRLRELCLDGPINEEHPLFIERFPRSLNYLQLESCPGLSPMIVYHWLRLNKKTLEAFKVGDWLPEGRRDFLNLVPSFIPQVRRLHLSQRCISATFFFAKFQVPIDRRNGQILDSNQRHPLESLVLSCGRHGVLRRDPKIEIDSYMVLSAIALQLHNLRRFRADDALGWWISLEDRKMLYDCYWIMRHRAQLRGDQRQIRLMGSRKKTKISLK